MRMLPLLLTALLPAAANAETQSATQAPSIPTVVVTASPLSATERALKECIANKCPVEQDVTATLRHAENLFVAGRYVDARYTLAAGRSRNRKFAKAYPVPVSNLLRAQSVVAAHLGFGDEYLFSAVDSLSALKSGLPSESYQVLSSRIEVADALNRLGRFEGAEEVYRDVISRARKLDLVDIAGIAELRLGTMYTSYARYSPWVYGSDARKIADAIIANPDPRYAKFAAAGRVLKARQLEQTGDSSAIEKIIADLRAVPATDRPVLVFSPPINPIRTAERGNYFLANNDFGGASRTPLQALPLRDYNDQWVDIGFYVTAEGRVADAGVLRQSSKLESDDWVKAVLKSVNGRRYLPLKLERTDPGAFRVERYTFTSLLEDKPGSRIPGHSPVERIETLDLTIDPAPAAQKPTS